MQRLQALRVIEYQHHLLDGATPGQYEKPINNELHFPILRAPVGRLFTQRTQNLVEKVPFPNHVVFANAKQDDG